jgi:Domain of unknown function (DUF4386)
MSTTTIEHPRAMARTAGVFYLVITACALFAYLHVRGQVIDVDDLAQTAANLIGHEQLYRFGFARGPIRMWSYAFSVSLTFFGVYCALLGILVFRSRFFPRILGVLMIVAGVTYWVNAFRLFLALPIPYVEWVTFVGEQSMTVWLLVVGLDEAKWRERASQFIECTIRPR